MVSVFLPILTVNEKNNRDSIWKRAKRTKRNREIARLCATALIDRKFPTRKYIVLLTRNSRGKLDADDNLPMALSAVKDGIADAIGIDDGDSRIKWLYDQRIVTKDSEIGVEVSIEQEGKRE